MISTVVPDDPSLFSTRNRINGAELKDTVQRNNMREARKIWSGAVDFYSPVDVSVGE
jgi:hypothetical protein